MIQRPNMHTVCTGKCTRWSAMQRLLLPYTIYNKTKAAESPIHLHSYWHSWHSAPWSEARLTPRASKLSGPLERRSLMIKQVIDRYSINWLIPQGFIDDSVIHVGCYQREADVRNLRRTYPLIHRELRPDWATLLILFGRGAIVSRSNNDKSDHLHLPCENEDSIVDGIVGSIIWCADSS